MEELSTLEPFGQGNYEPIFKFDNLFVLKADIVGSKHIRCLFAPNKKVPVVKHYKLLLLIR